ncbi:ABC transporter substrate-binding protein [Massilia sp. TS11]|uniref:substrate-binding periplasmic protein n=1 Tax=Massilia sp. TS11 TaxID=2908003 RepID=UPI001EDA49C6|nr:transporter substrate-binding domain-containing protein [Massilia sp. TS11]MCG2586392.1 transporter substrate-binding domain-containing protein [Massilia sp. TS11]
MQSRLAGFLILLAAPLAQASAPGWPSVLHITTEHSPPSSFLEDGRVTGGNTEKVREILARTGIKYTLDLLPWKRAYAFALQEKDACVFATTRVPERETSFKWVGPVDQGEWILFARADHKFQIRTLDDARNLRIGTYHGDARDEFLRARGFHTDPVQNDTINPKKLLMNRIDLWAGSMKAASSLVERYGWTNKIVPVLSFRSIKVYLACNPAVPDSLIDQMNAALEGMHKDGTVKKIEKKWENWVDPKTADMP